MSLTTLYILFVLFPGVLSLSLLVSIFSGISTGVLGMGTIASAADGHEEVSTFFFKYFKMSIAIFIISSVLVAVIPNKSQMLILIGGYAVTNNEQIQKLPDNVLKAANAYLEGLVEAPKKGE